MSMYSGFATGLRAGSGLVTQALENERASAKEERDEEDYKEKQATRERMNQAWGNVPKFGNEGPASSQAIPQDYQTPGDTGVPTPATAPSTGPGAGPASGPSGAAPVPATPVAAPDTSDDGTAAAAGTPGTALGNAPATAPATPAAAAPAPPPLSPEMQSARQMFNVAVASRDINAVNAARENIRSVDKSEIVNRATKMSDSDALDYVNKNINLDGDLPVTILKSGKGGYTMIGVDPDGTANQTPLNGAQVKQLVASHMLQTGGYGSEGLALAASTHKDINDLIGKHNEVNKDVATQNTTAQHYANADEVARGQLGVSQARLGLERSKAEAEKWKPIGPSDDNKGLLLIDSQGNTKVSPLPAGSDASQIWKKISGAGGGRTGPDKPIPAAGTMMEGPDGSTYQSDGVGGRISVKAPLPSERAGVLKKAGFTGAEADSLPWTSDGEHVSFNGQAYNVNKQSDMNQLHDDQQQAATNEVMRQETAARVAGAPGRRAQREQVVSNISNPNRFGPGAGLNLNVDPTRRDLYLNTDE